MHRHLAPFLALAAAFFAAPATAAETNGNDASTTPTAAMTAFDFPAPGEAPVVGIDDVKHLTQAHGSGLLVVNFWATWCAPCVAELPYFIRVSNEYEPKDVRVAGVSVDLKNAVETSVIPFLRERDIPYPNVVYYGDQMSMIEFFSDDWEGAIPATFFYDRNGRKVREVLGPLTYDELKAHVEELRPRDTTPG